MIGRSLFIVIFAIGILLMLLYSLYLDKGALAMQKQGALRVHERAKGRLGRVKAVCTEMKIPGENTPLPISILKNLLVIEKYKVVYCPIAKVGSTTMKRVLIASTSRQPLLKIESPHVYLLHNRSRIRPLASYNVKARHKILSTYFKFTFVRHPLTRLASAFRSKLLHPVGRWKENEMRIKQYNRKLPPIHINASDIISNANISDFIKFILYSPKSRLKRNVHWRDYLTGCDPCKINFDFIGKMETFQQDFDILQDTIFKHRQFGEYGAWHHGTGSDVAVVAKLMSNFTEKMQQDLYRQWKVELMLFGYNMNQIFPNFTPGNGL